MKPLPFKTGYRNSGTVRTGRSGFHRPQRKDPLRRAGRVSDHVVPQEPLEQTDSDAFWKLNQPFTEVLVGAPK